MVFYEYKTECKLKFFNKKNIIAGLERVAEELMGRRKWKLYQSALEPRRSEADEHTSDDDSMPAPEGPPPALKIKTIEEINAPENDAEIPRREPEINSDVREDNGTKSEPRTETILESLIKRPSTHPKVNITIILLQIYSEVQKTRTLSSIYR